MCVGCGGIAHIVSHRCYQIEREKTTKLINKPIVSIYPSISTQKIYNNFLLLFLRYIYKIDFNLLPLGRNDDDDDNDGVPKNRRGEKDVIVYVDLLIKFVRPERLA